MKILRKLKQLWCRYVHDHKGVEEIGYMAYRCKACGEEFDIYV